MSVKIEPSGRRSVAVEVEVPGTPEEVWQAIATGPGVSSWFVPSEIDGREGGEVISHFAPGMDARAAVTAWEPPHRFTAESHDLGPDAPALATEWIVEARSGGVCVVRVVHSLFASTDDWDNQLTSVESGWPTFFRILRLYLQYFQGQRCSNAQAMAMAPRPLPAVWSSLTDGLGLAGVEPGQRWSAPAGAPPFAGVVEHAGEGNHRFEILRLDEPASGLAFLQGNPAGGQTYVAINFYLYGDRGAEAAARDEPLWQSWMKERFRSGNEDGR
jgi:uncharacterized protein YndB with AHSA1/START domain